MSDPFGTVCLFAVGLFALGLGGLGLRRGKVVGVFDWQRSKQPASFWYGIVFQIGLGTVCIVLGIWKMFQ